MPKVHIVKITAHDGTGEVTLRYSMGGHIPPMGDTEWGEKYPDRIASIPAWSTGIADNPFTGWAKTGYGEIQLHNPDGHLNPLLGYAFDRRGFEILQGNRNATTATFTPIVGGVIDDEGLTVSGNNLSLGLADISAKLQTPVGNKLTGDAEGKRVPYVVGRPYNVTPVLVDKINRTYQVASSLNSLTNVGSNGNFTVAHTQDLANGQFTLSSNQYGAITCNPVASLNYVGESLLSLAQQVLDSGNIYSPDFTSFDSTYVMPVNGYWPGDTHIAKVMGELAASVNAVLYFDTAQQLRLAKLAKPTASSFTLRSEAHYPHGRLKIAKRLMPLRSYVLGYDQNFTPLKQVANTVSSSNRERLTDRWTQRVTAENVEVATQHLAAVEGELVGSLLRNEADARTIAGERVALFDGLVDVVQIKGIPERIAENLRLLTAVALDTPEYGMQDEVLLITKVAPNVNDNTLNIEGWRFR